MKVTDNLRYYLHEARLPDMPQGRLAAGKTEPLPDGLGVRPRRYRRLEAVHSIDLEPLGDMVFDWTESYIPSVPLGVDDEDERTGERFTVSCKPWFPIPTLPLDRAGDVERVSSWIDNFPLESVLRTMHLLYPESRSFRFSFCNECSAQPYFRKLSWAESSTTESGKSKRVNETLSLFSFPPWALPEEELQGFVRPQRFPQQRRAQARASERKRYPLREQEWLWSKVWDSCFSSDCRWFVVTTYKFWVFGVFSPDWSSVFVSPVYKYDSCDPTILELLLFWVASAMGYEGGWMPPETHAKSKLPIQCLSATVTDLFFNVSKAMAMVAYGADCSIMTPAL